VRKTLFNQSIHIIMKNFILLSSFLFIGSGSLMAQAETTNKPERITIVKTQKHSNPSSEAPLVKEKELNEKEIKALLVALDKKEAWIRENPEELELAIENGWFEDAAKTRKTLNQKLKALGA
jgi:hypothetical protein